MQWRRQKKVTHVIGSSNHVLLLARYQDAPPGEEDEEEGLRGKVDYVKGQDKEANAHTFDRNGQSGYKPRRAAVTTGTGGSTSGYASSGSRSHRDEGSGSPSQPKIIFNEDEYTRITTPRQDVLFKKGYLSRKKPWTGGNASTSATPSTTESQSASHSTADGSETTEDQQLLDRDSGTGEYPPMVEPGAQLGYGTFYDHASGYYYEYPVMLVGPAPVPAQVPPNVLAAVPCGPVPLRPIEWINPAFVPKLANQPYCLMDCQTSHSTETVTIMEEQQNGTVMATEAPNGTWNESGTGSASCSGSVAGETEEQVEEMADNATTKQQAKEQLAEEQQYPEQQQQQHLEEHHQQHLENGGVMTTVDPYLDPLLMQEPLPPPVHMTPHVVPAVPQPYMYPGHYMFGPPLVNVNGVTIQGGPLVRTMDVGMTMACAKRRKKRKKRKQKRLTLGNTEDEEEGEYSSECDNDVSSSRLPWSECLTTTTTTTAVASRPLNPECQEFQLRPALQSRVDSSLVSTLTVAEGVTTTNVPNALSFSVVETELATSREAGEKARDISTVSSPTNWEDAPVTIRNCSEQLVSEQSVSEQTPSESARQSTNSVGHKPRNKKVEVNGRASRTSLENTKALGTNEKPSVLTEAKSGASIDREVSSRTVEDGDNLSCANAKHKPLDSNDTNPKLLNNHIEKKGLTNGETNVERLSDPAEQTNVSNSISTSPRADTALPKKTRPTPAASVGSTQTTNTNGTESAQRLQRRCKNASVPRTTPSLVQSKKKNSKKSLKFVREPTPGPDLEDQSTRSDIGNGKVVRQLEAVELSSVSDDTHTAIQTADHDVASDKLTNETADRETSRVEKDSALKIRDSDDGNTKTNHDAIAGSNEDSGFESQTRLSDYPITNAVTEWLRRTNSPDVFLTSASTSDSETDEEDDEEMDAGPPKNLQGNPMPALSVNSGVDNGATTVLSRTASCGEFAKANNNNVNDIISDRLETNGVSANGRRKKDAINGETRRKAATKKIVKRNDKNIDEKAQSQSVSSLVSCRRLENIVTAVKLKNLPKGSNVGDVCEFTEEDSVAGMRVALSSRMNSKRVSARRTKTSCKIDRDSIENIDIKMRRKDDASGRNNETTDDSTVSVRTFEKGEIIVSEDGKLLPTSSYEPILSDDRIIFGTITKNRIDVTNEKTETRNVEVMRNGGSSENDENEEIMTMMMMSSVSIEEPDVLECWEAETIEPVITPKRMLQSTGVLCEGEAVEEDNYDSEKATAEHVQKYYRLARDSAVSAEEDSSESSARPAVTSESRTVPNNSEKRIEKLDFYNIEDIPIVVPDKNRDVILADEKIPIDEAFEVYESCYDDGKSPFLTSFDSKLFKQQRQLYGQNGEDPIPCRTVCCNLQ